MKLSQYRPSRRLRRALSLYLRQQNKRNRDGSLRCDPLARRACLAALIAANRDGDTVNVVRWGRDCDCYETTVLVQWPAHVIAFERELDHMYDDAEGPESAEIISPAEAAEFGGPYHRDRAAEAMGY